MKKLLALVLVVLAVVGAGIIVWRHAQSRKDLQQAARSSAAAVREEILKPAERLEALLKKCQATARQYEQTKNQTNHTNP